MNENPQKSITIIKVSVYVEKNNCWKHGKWNQKWETDLNGNYENVIGSDVYKNLSKYFLKLKGKLKISIRDSKTQEKHKVSANPSLAENRVKKSPSWDK